MDALLKGIFDFGIQSCLDPHFNLTWAYEPLFFWICFHWLGSSETQVPWAFPQWTNSPRLVATVLVAGTLFFQAASALTHTPQPVVTDEYAYLLGAETFSLGRWTNPTHPLWKHFETYQIIQEPSYQSKYLPLHSAVLALGKIMGGYFMLGVWLEVLGAVLALYWAALALTAPVYAGAAVLVFAARFCFSTMGNGYMGGGLAMAGGALVVGATVRLVRGVSNHVPSTIPALAFSVGSALLLHSRPYEGGILVLPLAFWIGYELLRYRRYQAMAQVALASCLVVGTALLALLYYNFKVTGHALTFPYALHDSTYIQEPVVLWSRGYPGLALRHSIMDRTYNFVAQTILQAEWQLASLDHFFAAALGKWLQAWKLLVGMAVGALVWLGYRSISRLPRERENGSGNLGSNLDGYLGTGLILTTTVFLVGIVSITYCLAQYAAAGLALLVIPAALGVERLATHSVKSQRVLTALFGAALVAPAASYLQVSATGHPSITYRETSPLYSPIRDAPGKQLVFVHYPPAGAFPSEWVYNQADIDTSPIVWARSLGADSDALVKQYYSDRQVWELDFGESEPRLTVTTPSAAKMVIIPK